MKILEWLHAADCALNSRAEFQAAISQRANQTELRALLFEHDPPAESLPRTTHGGEPP